MDSDDEFLKASVYTPFYWALCIRFIARVYPIRVRPRATFPPADIYARGSRVHLLVYNATRKTRKAAVERPFIVAA